MVCSVCNGCFNWVHNARTCPLGPKPKTHWAILGCKNIFKEPKEFYPPKKVTKPLEGLLGCKNIFKEPKALYARPMKVTKPDPETPTESEIRVASALSEILDDDGDFIVLP